MERKPKSWLDPDHHVPDLATSTAGGLLAVWQANRNSSLGMLAADEVLRRIIRGELILMEDEKQIETQR